MRAKSQKHAEYEIVDAILQQLQGITNGDIILTMGPIDDPVAYDRVTKGAQKLRDEFDRKREKLRKYLPEDHVDYLGRGEKP